MKLLPALFLLLGCGQAAPQPPAAVAPLPGRAENRALLGAVLTQELQEAGGSARNACIQPALSPALDDLRRWREGDRRYSAQHHLPDRPRSFPWYAPARANRDTQPVAPELNRRLNALLWRALDAPAPPVAAPIEVDLISAPFRRWRAGADCEVRSFSTPIVIGDIAFVERAQNCGGLCGGGSLLALQRIDGRWTPVAFINTWIS